MRLMAAVALLGLALLVAGLSFGPAGLAKAAPSAATVTVDAGNNWFCNPSFQNGVCDTTVAVGDTVTWNFVGTFPHTATACTSDFATCTAAQGFDSGNKTQGQTFSATFTQAGTFPYRCNVHPAQMRGRIIVRAATTTGGGTGALPSTGGPPVAADSQGGLIIWAVIALGGMLLSTGGGSLAYQVVRRRRR